jgi:superfamily I DNA/RNA helicase
VYHCDGEWSNRTPAVRAVVAWEASRRGAKVSPWDKAHLKRYIKQGATPDTDWMTALELSGHDKEYIRGVRRRGESLTTPGRVVISTIHEAKGGEAENVGLMLDTNRRVASNSLTPDGADDERRVLYVGMTRAMNTLHLLRPQRRFHYSVA